ncbi:class I SAM-dependent methyltransferase [Aliarcobacter butzleri]|uniref:class I SAM-dependent methyltransferase n=1 Tax=Aliarcobacter butzleri TaxID=28197 RepID=UPI0021B6C6D4|nr:class I SAM-dependent methyltransferase [Aliarcobacter butzleri]MCT7588133.1 class I SAM-dependent methyltransferase [Aliarcobacter butzleri]
MIFLIQGSSRSWAGDIEHCMYEIDGKPAIYWTVKRVYDNFDNAIVQLIAPEYDKGGKLESLKNDFDKLEIFYCFDSSPLSRMIEATKDLNDNEHFVRINALNFQFDIDFIKEMHKSAKENNYDCVKLEDDYPVNFVGEIYKVFAVRKIKKILQEGNIENPKYHEVHPKFLLMRLSEFKTTYYKPTKKITKNEVILYMDRMKQVIFSERHNIEGKNQISSGDQLTYHYELADRFLNEKNISSGNLLDIACGTGNGTLRFRNKGYKVCGADYDKNQIDENIKRITDENDITFKQENIMNLSFNNATFDVILCMETIEHVDPDKSLKELKRVLKKGGYLILSTPQNSTTGQCINPVHLYEYSLEEIKSIVSNYFQIETIIGLKAGRIYFEDDPIGANTMIFAKKI